MLGSDELMVSSSLNSPGLGWGERDRVRVDYLRSRVRERLPVGGRRKKLPAFKPFEHWPNYTFESASHRSNLLAVNLSQMFPAQLIVRAKSARREAC
jgi:hypothetical protein